MGQIWKSSSIVRLGISLIAVQWAGMPVQAQDSPGAAADTRDGGIADIIVTAQKRTENLQDVPISVAAVSAQAIDDMHATSLQGLQGSVPNVQIGNFSNAPASAVFTIRGIGVIEPDPYAGNTVGIVVDGVPQFFSMGALVDLYDIQRVEVLRGPQGTLFGANTTGGVVSVVNNQPTDKLEGQLDLGYGNYDHVQAAGVLNVPITEGLAGRFVVSHDKRDGWVTNVYDGSDLGRRNVTIFRGILRYDPGSNVDITLSGEYDRSRNGAPVVVAGDLPGDAQYVPAGVAGMYASPCQPAGSRCKAPNHYYAAFDPGATDADGNFVDPIEDRSDMDTYRGSLTVNVRDTAIGDVTSITAYKYFRLFEYTDQDGTPLFLDDTRRRTKGWQFSQELRTSIDVTDKINVILGGFYLKDHYDHYQHFRLNFAGGFSYDPATGAVDYGLPGMYQLNLQDQDNYSISGFAQSYVELTSQLRLQAGIRYTYEKTRMLASTTTTLAAGGVTTFDGTAPDGTPNMLVDSAAPPLGRKSWQNVGWKLGLDYRPIDDVLLYGYWARGFKSGGFTGRIGIEQDIGPYDPEKVDTFEAGFKTDLLDRRLRLNVAAFYTNYRNMQLAQIYFLGSGADLRQGNSILNVASAHIKGFEAELLAAPVSGLTLNGSLAYLSAKYNDFPYQLPDDDGDISTPPPVLDLKGQRLQNAPKWTATVGFTWEFPVGDMHARIGAQYNYTAEKLYSSIIDTARASVQPTHIVNVNATLPVTDNLTLSIWGTNILDNRYVNSVFDVPGTLGLVNYAPPRQYGVSARYMF